MPNAKNENLETDPSGGVMPTARSHSPNREWFRKRAAELGTSLSRISTIILNHRDLLGRALNGERKFKINEVHALARALRVPIPTILRHLGYPAAELEIQNENCISVLDSREQLENFLDRIEQYISDARRRIDEHARLTQLLEDNGQKHLVSYDLHRNFEEGMRVLFGQRQLLVKELSGDKR